MGILRTIAQTVLLVELIGAPSTRQRHALGNQAQRPRRSMSFQEVDAEDVPEGPSLMRAADSIIGAARDMFNGPSGAVGDRRAIERGEWHLYLPEGLDIGRMETLPAFLQPFGEIAEQYSSVFSLFDREASQRLNRFLDTHLEGRERLSRRDEQVQAQAVSQLQDRIIVAQIVSPHGELFVRDLTAVLYKIIADADPIETFNAADEFIRMSVQLVRQVRERAVSDFAKVYADRIEKILREINDQEIPVELSDDPYWNRQGIVTSARTSASVDVILGEHERMESLINWLKRTADVVRKAFVQLGIQENTNTSQMWDRTLSTLVEELGEIRLLVLRRASESGREISDMDFRRPRIRDAAHQASVLQHAPSPQLEAVPAPPQYPREANAAPLPLQMEGGTAPLRIPLEGRTAPHQFPQEARAAPPHLPLEPGAAPSQLPLEARAAHPQFPREAVSAPPQLPQGERAAPLQSALEAMPAPRQFPREAGAAPPPLHLESRAPPAVPAMQGTPARAQPAGLSPIGEELRVDAPQRPGTPRAASVLGGRRGGPLDEMMARTSGGTLEVVPRPPGRPLDEMMARGDQRALPQVLVPAQSPQMQPEAAPAASFGSPFSQPAFHRPSDADRQRVGGGGRAPMQDVSIDGNVVVRRERPRVRAGTEDSVGTRRGRLTADWGEERSVLSRSDESSSLGSAPSGVQVGRYNSLMDPRSVEVGGMRALPGGPLRRQDREETNVQWLWRKLGQFKDAVIEYHQRPAETSEEGQEAEEQASEQLVVSETVSDMRPPPEPLSEYDEAEISISEPLVVEGEDVKNFFKRKGLWMHPKDVLRDRMLKKVLVRIIEKFRDFQKSPAALGALIQTMQEGRDRIAHFDKPLSGIKDSDDQSPPPPPPSLRVPST